jgi:hypothetical protein
MAALGTALVFGRNLSFQALDFFKLALIGLAGLTALLLIALGW